MFTVQKSLAVDFLEHPCHCEVSPSGMSCLRDLKISINEPLFKNLAANARVDSSDFRESTQWKADCALLVVFGIPGVPVEQFASQIDSSFVAEKNPLSSVQMIFSPDFFAMAIMAIWSSKTFDRSSLPENVQLAPKESQRMQRYIPTNNHLGV